jgi:hypothetical protein
MISTNPAAMNARSSIRDNLDPDSNATVKSDLQKEKQKGHKKKQPESGTLTNLTLVS